MKLINLKIKGFKNLTGPNGWFEIDFTSKKGVTVLVGNNGSGKSNVLEAISAIFAGLNKGIKKFDFDFEVKFSLQIESDTVGSAAIGDNAVGGGLVEKEIEISYKKGIFKNSLYMDHLKIIANYSGEENRLFKKYFEPSEKEYIKQIKKTTKSSFKNNLFFIDKRDWQKVILTLAVYDFDFLKIIGIDKVKDIEIEFNLIELKKYDKNPNPTTAFIEKINSKKDENKKYNLDFLINKFTDKNVAVFNESKWGDGSVYGGGEINRKEFYINLFLAEQFDFIKNIQVNFSDKENINSLSEGEKKQILIYFILNVLANKDSVILLDEPDSYIHVGNKERLKKIFKKFRKDFGEEGEIILTTHSPTLMHAFNDKHLEFLENGQINKEGKRKILDKISSGKMSYTETEIFLNSKKPVLLVTEGKTDVKHIKLAAEKLKIDLEFDIYGAGSAGKLKDFLIGLPNKMFGDKIVIGIFDYDETGLRFLKKVGEKIEENKFYKVKDAENVFGISLPCPESDLEKHKNCPIEFLYEKEKLEGIIEKRKIDAINHNLNEDEKIGASELEGLEKLCFYKISESNTTKNNFAEKCKNLDKKDFEGFKVLFDKILEIKK